MTTLSAALALRQSSASRPEAEAPTDEELVARVGNRDEAALDELYTRYRPLVFSIALRVVGDPARAEDVVQDAFLSIWRKAASYSRQRGSARTWVSSIARNRAIDIVRATRERPVEDEEERLLLGMRDEAPPVVDQVLSTIEGEATRQALVGLPAEQRQAIALAYFGGLSHSEIAARTGLPLGTVKSRVRLGIQRMRESMAFATA